MASGGKFIPVLLLAALFPACRGSGGDSPPPDTRVLLATTTSTANTGLLDELLPAFERATGHRVDFVAVGSGAALQLGENGDVDLILAHAPEEEEEFIRAGYGEARIPIMYNDFILAGPASDPAAVRGAGSAAEAFRRIAESSAPFISRGDNSGTHLKELAIWREAGIDPAGCERIDAGQGMGACLLMASEKSAYVLSDRGTYLASPPSLDLEIVFEGDTLLQNPYSAIAVASARRPGGNHEGALALIGWLTSSEGRDRISRFRVDGEPLFHTYDRSRLPARGGGEE